MQRLRLTGRVALVTGSGTGIGRATALAFAREGADVVINYSRSEAEAHQTARDAAAQGVRALVQRADVSDDAAVRAMVRRTVDELGGLDILVNNAGTTYFVPLDDLEALTDEMWDRIFAVNVKGAFYCVRASVPAMRRRGEGLIVNVASIAGFTGQGSSMPYALSKAALINMTRTLARVLAPQIRVCAVAPGIVETRWVAGHEDHVRRYAADTPMQRPASAEDVANVIAAIATQATFLTGETVVVDGGRIMR